MAVEEWGAPAASVVLVVVVAVEVWGSPRMAHRSAPAWSRGQVSPPAPLRAVPQLVGAWAVVAAVVGEPALVMPVAGVSPVAMVTARGAARRLAASVVATVVSAVAVAVARNLAVLAVSVVVVVAAAREGLT